MDIHSLIEAIGTSVSKAQQGIEQHSIERFFDYFQSSDATAVSNGINAEKPEFKPITAKVVMPCSDNVSKTASVDVPLVALANHRQVHLNKVTVKVKTRLTADNSGNVMADINAPVSNAANSPENTETASNDDISEIEMVFNVTDSSEGTSRIVQNISKTI